LLIFAAALACLCGGAYALWLHACSSQSQAYRAPAALALIGLAALQCRLGWNAWRRRDWRHASALRDRLVFWRRLLAGASACYLAGLVLGPDPSVGYFFCAALAAWYTLVLWAVVSPQPLFSRMPEPLRGRAVRLAEAPLVASLLAVFAAEAALRVYSLATGGHWPAAYLVRTHSLPAGTEWGGRTVNSLGYWDDEFELQPPLGAFRVAALGDVMLLSGDRRTNFLDRAERLAEGIEILNFAVPAAGPREYAAQAAHETAAYRPDLVLACISIGDDLTAELPLPGAFDWRGLRLFQLGAQTFCCAESKCGEGHGLLPWRTDEAAATREAYLRQAARRLAVCRTPIEGFMSARWRETIGHLEDLDACCRRQGAALALVLVPAEFQANPSLCDALCRAAGCESQSVDLELPQRRLTVFAEERGLPVLDLLPPMRACGESPYLRNQFQWNALGNDIAARALSEWLQSRFQRQIAAQLASAGR
jgi:hypothetical protein